MPHTDPAARREYLRGYYRRAPERQVESTERWRTAHPLRYHASHAAAHANRNAAIHSAPGHVTMQDVLALWERQPVCVSCGEGRGIDHIEALLTGGGNVPENLQTMCRFCNRAKGPQRRPWPKRELT
jgi:hypothetical protein